MIEAMLASPCKDNIKLLIQSPAWWVEEKYDGCRLLTLVNREGAKFYNRDAAENAPPKILQGMTVPFGDTIFDGELLDDEYVIFDLVAFNGTTFEKSPYAERREALELLLRKVKIPNVRLSNCAKTEDEKFNLISECAKLDREGVMLKSKTSTYESGRTNKWLKFKFYKTADMVIIEEEREGKPEAYTIGVYDPNAGGPFAPFREVSGVKIPLRYQHEQDIKLHDVIEVRYLYATPDRKLFQPVYLRKRHDKLPQDCTYEQCVLQSSVTSFTDYMSEM